MCVVCVLLCFFFLQAEDGIRDLVRSRGLGDVYKRQGLLRDVPAMSVTGRAAVGAVHAPGGLGKTVLAGPVSYTHLTLPTSDLV